MKRVVVTGAKGGTGRSVVTCLAAAKLLGGKVRDRVRCYIRYGVEFHGRTMEEAVEQTLAMGTAPAPIAASRSPVHTHLLRGPRGPAPGSGGGERGHRTSKFGERFRLRSNVRVRRQPARAPMRPIT